MLLDSSIMALSILMSRANSKMMMLEFSCDIELIFFKPLTVPREDSNGFVAACSTCSGLAPG